MNNDQHGADPKAVVRLVTDNFGGKLVRVRKLVAMCELALKYQPVPGVPDPQPPADADTRIFAYGQVTTLGKPSGNIWQCFNLEKGKAINQKFRLLTNNFGRDDVAVIRGVQLCEDAMKLRQIDGTIVKSGEATGHVAECFRIESKLDPKARVTLTTNNFGAVDVVVRRAIMMCEPGEKTPIYELPSDIDFDAAGD